MSWSPSIPLSDYRPYLLTPSDLPDPWMQQSKNQSRAAAAYFPDSNEILPTAVPQQASELSSGQYLGVSDFIFWLPNIKEDTSSFFLSPNASGQRWSIPFYIYVHDPGQEKVLTVSDVQQGGRLFVANQNSSLMDRQIFTVLSQGYNLYSLALQPFNKDMYTDTEKANSSSPALPPTFTISSAQPSVFLQFDFSSSYSQNYAFEAKSLASPPSIILEVLNNICASSVPGICPSCNASLYQSGVGFCGVDDKTFSSSEMNMASQQFAKKKGTVEPPPPPPPSSSSSVSSSQQDTSTEASEARQSKTMENVALGVFGAAALLAIVLLLPSSPEKK